MTPPVAPHPLTLDEGKALENVISIFWFYGTAIGGGLVIFRNPGFNRDHKT